MKKLKILYPIIGIIGIILLLIIITNKDNKEEVVKEKPKIYSTGIAMMLETSFNSGEYKETTNTTWEEAINQGYTFNSTRSTCENGSILTWDETNKTIKFSGNTSDKCYVYFDLYEKLSEHIIELYTVDGTNGLYLHDGVGETYGAYEAGDNSYRYNGANPGNYVCLGSSEVTCPEDNLYKIIGVFDNQIKLIKKTSIGDLAWASNNSNTWGTSSLKTYLNGTYYNGLDATIQNLIAEATWKVGGNTNENVKEVGNAKTNYENEIITPATNATDGKTEDTFKVGLMYISDYRYAADPTQANAWSAVLAYYYDNATVKANNWMYNGVHEWTISRNSNFTNSVYTVYNTGRVNDLGGSSVNVTTSVGVRPCFYLKSSVKVIGGTGSSDSPYRVSL